MKYLVKVELPEDEIGCLFLEVDADTPEDAVEKVRTSLIFRVTPIKEEKKAQKECKHEWVGENGIGATHCKLCGKSQKG